MVIDKNGWLIQKVGERVDSFNHHKFKDEIEPLVEKHQLIALDVQRTAFMSMTTIMVIVSWADRLIAKGGQMMLIGPSEKLKRQFAIYGSLDHMLVTKPGSRIPDLSASESPEPDESAGF